VAHTTGLQSSSRLLSIVGANALLELQPGTQTLPAGTMVPALLLANL
jgi:molybdopterin biosynthesis enzyme